MLLFAIIALVNVAPANHSVMSYLVQQGWPMKLHEHCAQSPFQVGDVLPPAAAGMPPAWIMYISQVRDRSGQNVGWVYMSDRGTMAVGANAKMSKADQALAKATDIPLSAYPYQRNPWKDLTVGPCSETFPKHLLESAKPPRR
jgi:hypothetical protein